MTSGSSSTNGSSPRERGTDKETQELSQAPRFIPACAGNSWHGHLSHGCTPVHPRVRGEQWQRADVNGVSAGSSPRARGTVHKPNSPPALARFIPACAGNSWAPSTTPTAASVHPRVRGEQGTILNQVSAGTGSSPRARGTASAPRWPPAETRFIPACAGNSPRRRRCTTTRPVHPRVRGEQARHHRRCGKHLG